MKLFHTLSCLSSNSIDVKFAFFFFLMIIFMKSLYMNQPKGLYSRTWLRVILIGSFMDWNRHPNFGRLRFDIAIKFLYLFYSVVCGWYLIYVECVGHLHLRKEMTIGCSITNNKYLGEAIGFFFRIQIIRIVRIKR